MKTEVLISNLQHSDVETLKCVLVPAITVLYGNATIPTGKVLNFDVVSFHQDLNSTTIKVVRRDTGKKAIIQKFGEMPAKIK